MSVLGKVIRNALFKKWAVPHQNAVNQFVNISSKMIDVPLPPKKPLTAYMIFCKENRKELKKENPDLTGIEQIKILAEKWNKLTNESKKPFEILARENTLIYGEEHKKFYESLTEEQKIKMAKHKTEKKIHRQQLKLKKALKESGLPKPPASSAYTFFVHIQAKDNNKIKQPKEFIKEVATRWKALPEEKKKFYEEQAQEQKIQHLIEVEQWKEKMIKEGKQDLLNEYNRLKGHSEMKENLSTPQPKVKRKATTKHLESK